MLKAELIKRNLPALKTREEMMEILQREVYGYLPNVRYRVFADEPKTVEKRFACGNVIHSFVNLTVTLENGSHTFRVDRLLHNDGKKRPLILLNNFHPMGSTPYFPIEELSESEMDFLVFCYKDISSDDGDFSNGLARLLLPEGQKTNETCGKIGVWAWAAMRVLDYGLTLKGTDADNIGIAGHSRLGKTALYTAMMDERFRFVFSNAAGCAGDSLAHGNSGHGREKRTPELGELICDIVENFPYWFCKNYAKYAHANVSESFDQHFLLATIAPRCVLVGSCNLDFWADPCSQQLCALAAGEAWEAVGLPGLVGSRRYLNPGEALTDGNVGYFLIHSLHFLSRHGWKYFLEFIEKHKK
ncbi:MAG: hypothetical protein E7603_08100 [Ruminococcaceae bacterium]|nr:hypothetical protein [Oscillospiraceae bacterium]